MPGRRRRPAARPGMGLVGLLGPVGPRRTPASRGRHRGASAPLTAGVTLGLPRVLRDLPDDRRPAVIAVPLAVACVLAMTVAATAAPGPGSSPVPLSAGLTPPAAFIIPTSPGALGPQEAFIDAPAAPAPVRPLAPAVKAADAGPVDPATAVPSALAASGIPRVALKAYKKAARTMRERDPRCGLRWELLAAIGRVESNHGRSYGSVMTRSGMSVPGVLGPVLDGRGAFALIRDTDGGRYDGDKKYDRAVGPMQFIPSTWAVVATDGNRDGKKQVQNVWDAAASAAVYFCRGETRLGTPSGLARNIFRYNRSDAYVALVLRVMQLYGAGVKVVAEQDPPKAKPKPKPKPKPAAGVPAPAPRPTSSPPASPPSTTAAPSPTPTSEPEPTPTDAPAVP